MVVTFSMDPRGDAPSTSGRGSDALHVNTTRLQHRDSFEPGTRSAWGARTRARAEPFFIGVAGASLGDINCAIHFCLCWFDIACLQSLLAAIMPASDYALSDHRAYSTLCVNLQVGRLQEKLLSVDR